MRSVKLHVCLYIPHCLSNNDYSKCHYPLYPLILASMIAGSLLYTNRIGCIIILILAGSIPCTIYDTSSTKDIIHSSAFYFRGVQTNISRNRGEDDGSRF